MLNSKRISEADRQTGEQIDRQKNRLTARQASPSGAAAINQDKLYVDYRSDTVVYSDSD